MGAGESQHRIFQKEDKTLWLFFAGGTWWLSPELDLENKLKGSTALCRFSEHPDERWKLYTPGSKIYCPYWEAWKKPFQKGDEEPPEPQGPCFDFGPAHHVDGRLILQLEANVSGMANEIEELKDQLAEAYVLIPC